MSETAARGRGFGVAGALPHDIVRTLAPAAEAAGYRTFWVNDTPQGDGLAALAAAAAVTRAIRLGVGVIPLDRVPAARIAARVAALGLPEDRLTLGIGSGGQAGGVRRVRDGAPLLEARTAARVEIGALGPKMCALAGEAADGVLLNWLTPAWIAPSAEITLHAAEAAGRPRPQIDAYIRVALGDAAIARLREEADRYASYPAYAANFARMGAAAIDTAVAGTEPDQIRAGLAAFAGPLDEVIVRAIVGEETADAYLALLHAAAPRSSR
ncbi:MAG TPA: LLM class flavin-dependent oxidoreductase [Thermomicrobiales bacterium]|nr:LLM class flavin-dependent oxidoreductase [Thermomicrobiales bacterium]